MNILNKLYCRYVYTKSYQKVVRCNNLYCIRFVAPVHWIQDYVPVQPLSLLLIKGCNVGFKHIMKVIPIKFFFTNYCHME